MYCWLNKLIFRFAHLNFGLFPFFFLFLSILLDINEHILRLLIYLHTILKFVMSKCHIGLNFRLLLIASLSKHESLQRKSPTQRPDEYIHSCLEVKCFCELFCQINYLCNGLFGNVTCYSVYLNGIFHCQIDSVRMVRKMCSYASTIII